MQNQSELNIIKLSGHIKKATVNKADRKRDPWLIDGAIVHFYFSEKYSSQMA